MIRAPRSVLLALLLMASSSAWADQLAFEYFVIKSERLPVSAKSEDGLNALSSSDLEGISEVHGWLESLEQCSVSFSSPKFRLDIRTKMPFQIPNTPKMIDYSISAGDSQGWNIASTSGQAVQVGTSYLTRGWRSKSVIVLFRPINLKR